MMLARSDCPLKYALCNRGSNPTKCRESSSLPRGYGSDRGGRHQTSPCSPSNWLDLKGVRQVHLKVCISLTKFIGIL